MSASNQVAGENHEEETMLLSANAKMLLNIILLTNALTKKWTLTDVQPVQSPHTRPIFCKRTTGSWRNLKTHVYVDIMLIQPLFSSFLKFWSVLHSGNEHTTSCLEL